MVCITFIEHDGTAHSIEAQPGVSLMEAASRNNIPAILADCGGDGGCATCHVYLERQWQPITGERSVRERSTLRFAVDPSEESRLACYIKITEQMNGLTVKMPESQL
jgi:2Fe-2S ferredoxin